MNLTSNEKLGAVTEIRPKALFQVRLESGQVIVASLGTQLRQVTVRLLVGQKVIVRLSTHDPHRGQIIQIAP